MADWKVFLSGRCGLRCRLLKSDDGECLAFGIDGGRKGSLYLGYTVQLSCLTGLSQSVIVGHAPLRGGNTMAPWILF